MLEPLDDALGARVFLKCENLQRMGAFKFRGAFNALSRFSPAQRKAGVVAFSSGNHAQAIALAARLLEIPATIVTAATTGGFRRMSAAVASCKSAVATRM